MNHISDMLPTGSYEVLFVDFQTILFLLDALYINVCIFNANDYLIIICAQFLQTKLANV